MAFPPVAARIVVEFRKAVSPAPCQLRARFVPGLCRKFLAPAVAVAAHQQAHQRVHSVALGVHCCHHQGCNYMGLEGSNLGLSFKPFAWAAAAVLFAKSLSASCYLIMLAIVQDQRKHAHNA